MSEPFTGRCLCGAVRYRASAAPHHPTLCHCESCRRAAGAPAVAWVTFPRTSFAFTAGEPQRFRSSARVERSFCGRCGTPLTYVHDDKADRVDVTTASLDEPERAAPEDHTWVADRLPWWRPEPRWPEFPEARVDAPPELEVIGGTAPEGICGSGLVDALAELLRTGRMNAQGRFDDGLEGRFVLSVSHGEHGEHAVSVTESDVNQLAQAKGA
ncbi:MAG: GFA family protein, partial [Myxococcota bacterium]